MSALTALFRTCDVTGFRVHRPAENLIKANVVAAVVFILIGGIYGLLVALTRWPKFHLLDVFWYYRALTGHGLNMLIFWVIFFEVAGLYFGSSVVLNSRLAAPGFGWLAFGLMVAGALMVNVSILQGKADVLMTSYPPLQADPFFYLGVILFAVGALVAVILFFATLVVARREKTFEGSLPLFTFGLMTAAIIAVVTLLHGAAVYIPTFLWSLGILPSIDPAAYRTVWWALGHMSQQINVAAMISIWYLIGTLTVGSRPVNEKVCRGAFLLYILFINLASAHHLLVDPGVSSTWKVWNTSYAMYLGVVASMIHAYTVPASIELAQRRKGFNKGLFEWLRKAPWGNPAFAGMALSVLTFGFIGGLTGPILGTEQVNIIAHNTYRITGHFHGTVVGGTTLAFMAITYYLVPLIFRRQIAFPKMATLQVYLFGLGIMGLSTTMMLAGSYGVPRRHWDIAFSSAPFGVEINPAAYMWLGLMGLSAIVAAIGGALYVINAVATVFFGKRMDSPRDLTFPISAPAPVPVAPVSGKVAVAGSVAKAEV